MKFSRLRDIVRDKATSIQESKDKSARYRARSYDRVAELLDSKYHPDEVVTKTKIDALDLTEYMTNKVWDYSKGIMDKPTTKLAKKTTKKTSRKVVKKTNKTNKTKPKKRAVVTKDNPNPDAKSNNTKSKLTAMQKTKLINNLDKFMGLGTERARDLVSQGLTHINQLHQKKWLSKLPEETRLFLTLKPNRAIPNADIKTIEPIIKQLENKSREITLVGSYRRGKPTSKDIDIMIVSDEKNAIETFLQDLKTHFNNKVYPYSQGNDKLSIIIDASELLSSVPKSKIYKLDVFRVEPANKIPMLLYSTGSKEHNILMRGKAKKLNMLLNQKGLFKKIDDTLQKIPNLNTEQDYFTALKIPYKEPANRI